MASSESPPVMAPPLPVHAGTHGLLDEVRVLECAAFQPHAPSHLEVFSEYSRSHTAPIFGTLLSHSRGCYCPEAGYIGVRRFFLPEMPPVA